jgi:hypothetical protein
MQIKGGLQTDGSFPFRAFFPIGFLAGEGFDAPVLKLRGIRDDADQGGVSRTGDLVTPSH